MVFGKLARVDGNQSTECRLLSVFYRNGPTWFLTDLEILRDGRVRCFEPNYVDLSEFERLVRTGRIATALPPGAEVRIDSLGVIKTEQMTPLMTPAELIVVVKNELDRLNRRPILSHRCQESYHRYLHDPSPPNRETLRKAYEAIPLVQRQFALGDMDLQDFPIREILYGSSAAGPAPPGWSPPRESPKNQ